MLDTLLTIGIFLLGLSVLIVIHELGHYWAARIFGIKVEEFALFWGKKLVGFKRGDTEWRINAIPIGGYVKIAGMLDESFDEDQVAGDPEPWEFRSKPTWQRLIVMLGGIIMNIILGIILFIGLKYAYGDEKIVNADLPHGINVLEGSPAYDLGFRTGDVIKTYKGTPAEYFTDVADPNLLVDRGKYFDIERNGQAMRIDIPDDYMNAYMDYEPDMRSGGLFAPDMEPIVLVPDTATNTLRKKNELPPVNINAWTAGLRDKDKIVAIDSTPVKWWSDLRSHFKEKPEQSFQLTVLRNGAEKQFQVQTDTGATIGVLPFRDTLYSSIRYSFGEAIPVGTAAAWEEGIVRTVKGLGMLFTGNADPRKSLSGPVKIAKIYGQGFKVGGWKVFWGLTAMLSMVLAVMNLLPIPVLDGGQILILSIEAVIGREIPQGPKMWILRISFYLVIGLMLLIILNDIIN